MMTRTTGRPEMPLPRRHIKQILRASDRGGRRAASRTSQRAVARDSTPTSSRARLTGVGARGRLALCLTRRPYRRPAMPR
jgi:hypothetical protein